MAWLVTAITPPWAAPAAEIRCAEIFLQGFGVASEKVRQPANGLIATWWAAIDVGTVCRQGFSVGTASGIAALGALDSRENVLDLVYDRVGRRFQKASGDQEQERQR